MELCALKGIGEKTAVAFNRLGIFSAEDLIWHYPRDYETFDDPIPLYRLSPGKVQTVSGMLQRDASLNTFNGLTVVNAYLSDMTGRLQLSWFNAPYIKNTLKTGRSYIFRGRVYEKNGRLVMNQPKIYDPETYNEKYAGRLMPIYPLTRGLTNNLIIKVQTEALGRFARGSEFLPDEILEKYSLMQSDAALIRLHFPRSADELEKARSRIAFNEFFMNILAGKKLRRDSESITSDCRCRPHMSMIRFMAGLPFELTRAQTAAYRDITRDMNSAHPMNRLLEGDVGSGKTIVAFLAMIYAALNGMQSAIMVPTSVLAVQHYSTFAALLEEASGDDSALSGISIELLTGGLDAASKREALRRIREHEADIIIGTQALFMDGVEYDRLGLIITDEQHRFGVSQREALFRKGERPHTLIMSATPIPRTLSMILYSSMDISVLDARPSGRLPVKNCVVGPSYRRTAYRFINDEIKKKHQAYIICPSIEEDPSEAQPDGGTALENVADYTRKLRKVFPPGVSIASLHGRMKADEKDAVMASFKAHETDILVSTTVVEVGVDVPDATVMMIENAERYGLAQLHQLRGRVGRGSDQSYCIMINTSESEKAAKRLSVVNTSNDGFYIAEEDLKTRGPGDMFGTRQSGEMEFIVADIYRDAAILKKAGSAADEIMASDPGLELPANQLLRKKLGTYLEKGSIL